MANIVLKIEDDVIVSSLSEMIDILNFISRKTTGTKTLTLKEFDHQIDNFRGHVNALVANNEDERLFRNKLISILNAIDYNLKTELTVNGTVVKFSLFEILYGLRSISGFEINLEAKSYSFEEISNINDALNVLKDIMNELDPKTLFEIGLGKIEEEDEWM